MRRWIDYLRPGRASDEPATHAAQRTSLPFAEVEGTLALYVTALSDGTLRVASSSGASSGSYTDGRTIFFPPAVDAFAERADDRRLYRVMAAWKVLQARSGSLDIAPLLGASSPSVALALYEVIHGEWLDRRLAITWPGLAADLCALRADALERRSHIDPSRARPAEALLQGLLRAPLDAPLLPGELAIVSGISGNGLRDALPAALAADEPSASLRLALELASQLPPRDDEPLPPVHFRGRIRVDLLRDVLDRIETPAADGGTVATVPTSRPRHDPIMIDARFAEQRVPKPRRMSGGGRSAVALSLGDREPTMTFTQVPLTEAERQDALLYDEWDYRRNDYLREWCAVRLRHPRGGSTEPVDKILRQNGPLIARLKQQFEALRPERLRLTRQLDGDDLDLNAIVDAHADQHAGLSTDEKLYSRILQRERNIALGCLIDLSGSTGAWIDDDPRNDQVIEVTRRAIVFLCEALTMLDDRYALLGFTSSTRKRCDISVVKGFEEHYGQTVKGRIAGLAPGSYTRIGPAIRHTTQVLTQQPARLRLLLLISDGRPNDFDGYGARYGIEDTRKALIEARQRGVATFALTIDAEARDYMPYMFGRNHYVVVENAPALALKLAEVYRRLTVQ